MIMLHNNITRVLCALLICAGSFMFAGCTDDPLGGGENTEQEGGESSGDNQKPSGPVVPISIEVDELTSTTVKFNMTLDAKGMAEYQEAGLIFSAIDDLDMASECVTTFQLNRESYSKVFTGLKYNTTYCYTYYLKQNGLYIYGQTLTFHTSDVVVELTLDEALLTATSARINGAVTGLADADKSLIEVGVFYSSEEGKVENGQGIKLTASEISSDNAVSFDLSELVFGTTYYYCSYVKQGESYVYGEVKTFVAGSVSLNLSAGSITATTAQISGTVEGMSESDKSLIEVGVFYSSEEGKVEKGKGTKLTASVISPENVVSFALTKLSHGTTYYYCSYVKQGDGYVYGEVKTFVAGSVSLNLSDASSITIATAQISGTIVGWLEEDKSDIEIGVAYYSNSNELQTNISMKIKVTSISQDGSFDVSLKKLSGYTKYFYCSYVKQNSKYVYGDEIKEFQTVHPYGVPSVLNVSAASDLSSSASANCYIVSKGGLYKFKMVKGNSSESVGNVASASILWEAFGTSTCPALCELIKGVCYKDGYIAFQTADTFKEGNAVIAAKDADGNILWSWHIWLTDQPQGQVYYNNAGTMMDRNLGATSATPGDVGALGLLYQWGRKDPFLGSSSIIRNTVAKSTITWPSAVSSDSSNGTIAYATARPTIFITYNSNNYDWYYTGSLSTDNTRWTTSDQVKSIYDPCPAGWRVPDGGSNGVWSKALGSSYTPSYDFINDGMNFSGKFGRESTIWYPASGYRSDIDGSLFGVGHFGDGYGCYWSASRSNISACRLFFYNFGDVYPSKYSYRAFGSSVRCLQVID